MHAIFHEEYIEISLNICIGLTANRNIFRKGNVTEWIVKQKNTKTKDFFFLFAKLVTQKFFKFYFQPGNTIFF